MFVRAEAEGREVHPGETMTVELALREGGTIEGRAVTERGFPLRSLALEVRVGNEPAPRRMFTQPDGTFTLAAVQGRVSVVALMGARPVARSEVEVADGATVRLTLTVNGALRRVEGRVVDRRGFPVQGASVHMTAVERGEMGTASSVTSADGTFDTLIAGTRAVTFEARHGDYAPRTVRVDDVSHPVRIELSEGAELTMELRDDGCATAPPRVELRTTCGPVTITATDRDVAVPHLCAGRAPMVVDAEGCVRAVRTVTIPAQGRVQVGRVEIVAGGGVEGTVVDARRQPVAGAVVRRADAEDDDPTGVARTDRQGGFALSAVPTGDVSLVAVHPVMGRSEVTTVRVLRGTVARGREIRYAQEVGERRESLPVRAITLADLPGRGGGRDVVVRAVNDGSTAERAGLRAGDRVVSVGGEEVESVADATRRLEGPLGDLVVMEVEREGVRRTVRFNRER
ncbi:MAG: carboxypeptidase regulatory-like domain-containing protein [Polyangiales bacterium]